MHPVLTVLHKSTPVFPRLVSSVTVAHTLAFNRFVRSLKNVCWISLNNSVYLKCWQEKKLQHNYFHDQSNYVYSCKAKGTYKILTYSGHPLRRFSTSAKSFFNLATPAENFPYTIGNIGVLLEEILAPTGGCIFCWITARLIWLVVSWSVLWTSDLINDTARLRQCLNLAV